MHRTVPALLLGTLVVVLATACSGQQYADGSGSVSITTSTPTTSTNAPPASTNPVTMDGHPVCSADGLTVSLGSVSTAMNYTYQIVAFTNTSAHTCAMSGFPTISFAVDNGQQIGTPATQDGTAGAVVILRHGQVATTTLAIADPSMFPTDLCQPTAVDGLRVFPPGTTTAMYLARPGLACAVSPPSPQLKIQTVKSTG